MYDLGKIIKIVLAALFFLCLIDMPYGYYQLVRFLALLGFTILAYKSYEEKENIMVILYIGLALLFQPIAKISLGREIWNLVDIIVGLGLLLTILPKRKRFV